MKIKLKMLIAFIIYIAGLIVFAGCEEGSLLENRSSDPMGVWSGTLKDSDSNEIIITYTLSISTYVMSRSIAGTVDYTEDGSWILNNNNLFTFTPTASNVWNSTSKKLEEVTTEVEYTAVCFENSFSYYYWDSNSEFMIIDLTKE